MIRELNRSKWFGSRPVLYLDNPGGAGGGGSSGGAGGSGGGAGSGSGAGGAGGAGAGGGGGDSGGAGAGGAGGSGGGAAGAGQGAGAGAVDWKTAPEHFRKSYDELRQKYEPFEKLGVDAAQLTSTRQSWERISNAALDLGDQLAELGVEYTEQEILELLNEDPIKVMNFLQDRLAKAQEEGGAGAGDGRDLEAQIQAGIDRAIGPIQERENARMTNEANALFERTAHQELTAMFKEEGVNLADVPGEEMFMYISAASELFKYNLDDIHALKHEGKTAPIQKAVRDAKAYLDKYFMARATRERGAVAGGRGAGRGAGAGAGNNGQLEPGFVRGADGKPRRATLDELADNPEIIGSKYK